MATQRLDAKCWKGKHKQGTKVKGGVIVNNCVPTEGADSNATPPESNLSDIFRDAIDQSPKLELPDIVVGSTVKIGKFKNRLATILGFAADKHGQPILITNKGRVPLFKPRLTSLMPTDTEQPLQDDAQPRVIVDKGW